ncbi:hypothetical protein [Pectinatus haikarae]|nr:hypothetical protein [Pectinatus haikarae]
MSCQKLVSIFTAGLKSELLFGFLALLSAKTILSVQKEGTYSLYHRQ